MFERIWKWCFPTKFQLPGVLFLVEPQKKRRRLSTGALALDHAGQAFLHQFHLPGHRQRRGLWCWKNLKIWKIAVIWWKNEGYMMVIWCYMMVILSYEMILLLFFCHCFGTAFARNDFWVRDAILITLTFVAAFAEQTHKIYSYIMQSWENKIQLCQSLPPFAGTFATIHQKAAFALLSRIFRAQGLNFRQR